MISLLSKTSLTQLEKLRDDLIDGKDEILRLPKHLELGGAFGIPVSIIQFIAEWSRNQSNATLQLYNELIDLPLISEFAGTPHGMTALYFAETLKGSNGDEEEAKSFKKLIIPYVNAMQMGEYDGTMNGRGAFLCCFASARNEFLQPLYRVGTEIKVRSRSDFVTLVEQMLNKVAPEAVTRLDRQDITNLSQLIYELFSNTEDHARTDENGNLISRSVRGIYLKFIPKGYSETENGFSLGDITLNRFLMHSLVEPQKQGYTASKSFLEISVFDTGPGLARRWLSKNKANSSDLQKISVTEEFNLVHRCFTEKLTTKDEFGKGEGLTNVINSLQSLRAYLRLRTGRLCLVKDFTKASNSNHNDAINNKLLSHWKPDTPLLSDSPGATYTAIIPLGVKRI